RPSRRSNSPTAPSTPDAMAASASRTIRSLYAAVNARRFGRAGEVALSGTPERAASRTADAVPSRGAAAADFLTDMFSIVTDSQLALEGNCDRVYCLSHVGTEGLAVLADAAPDAHRERGGELGLVDGAQGRARPHVGRGLAEQAAVRCLVVVRVEEREQPGLHVVQLGHRAEVVEAALAQRAPEPLHLAARRRVVRPGRGAT